LRVLHLTTEFPPIIFGGLGTAVGGLAYASVRAGIQVGVLLIGEGPLTAYGERVRTERAQSRLSRRGDPVTVFEIAWREAWAYALHVVRWWRPDVIHLHVFWLWDIAAYLREQTGVPLVYTVHSLDLAEYELGNGPAECLGQWNLQQAVLSGADLIVAPTRSERNLVVGYCPAVADRVTVAGHGIDDLPVRFSGRGRRDTDDEINVLFVGRFVDRKGVRDLLAAIPRILERAPSARFILAGGHRGTTAEEIESWWLWPQLRPFRDRIRFTGWLSQEDTAHLYAASDVLVVPSWYEPFGMVVLEGMLNGMAIAASDVGGPSEILQHERTGLLFPPRDHEALTDAVVRLVKDSALRESLAGEAAEEVRRAHLWPTAVEGWRVIYEDTVAGVGYGICPR
jgi:glycogen synthase